MSKDFHYEFGGPVGTLLMIISLPMVVISLYLICNDKVCLQDPWQFNWSEWFQKEIPSLEKLFSFEATAIYLGWLLFHVVLERVLPGETVEGVPLPNKQRLKYTISGHLQFWICLLTLGYGTPVLSHHFETEGWCNLSNVFQIEGFSPLPIYLVYDHYPQMITASILFTFLFSGYL
jgi:hypothetical protein